MPDVSSRDQSQTWNGPTLKKMIQAAETPTWRYGRYSVEDVAQDQCIIKLKQGRETETFYALRQDTGEDTQSNAGRKILKPPDIATLSAVRRVLHLVPRSSWDIGVAILETDRALDEGPQHCEAERNDQSSALDESAEEWTSDRLADELLAPDAENDWPRLRELIVIAEDFGFTPQKSEQLAPRLLDFAIRHRDSDDPQDAPGVLSAIRTGASMIPLHDIGRLLKLLEAGHPIETSLVALKMVGRIFEAQPPEEKDQHTVIAGEVREIAKSFLDRRLIAITRNAAMAQLAVYALVAMASSEAMTMVKAVRKIDISWFTKQTARELRELRNTWNARSERTAPEVLELLDRATLELTST